jgi:rhodanese-related sulfurtransferase
MRSSRACQKLLENGHDHVMQLKGGLSSWKAAGLTVQADHNAPISLFRQVQIVAGSLVAIGTGLGVFVSPWFLLLSGFVGCGLVFAGVTNTCAMGMLLMKLPYNQRTLQS